MNEIFVITGVTGVWEDAFWSVAAFTEETAAKQHYEDLRNLIDSVEKQEDDSKYGSALFNAVKKLDKNAQIIDGYLNYKISKVKLLG